MPRTSKPPPPAGIPDTTFVLDNGAYTLKAGFARAEPAEGSADIAGCETIPNCLVRTRDRKTYVGIQCDEIGQWSEALYRRPLENGHVVSWEAQKEIWDQSFFDATLAKKDVYVEDAGNTTLIFTEAPNTMLALQRNTDEIIMEEWGFGGYMRTVGPSLNAYNDLHPLFESEAAIKAKPEMRDSPMECVLVVDSGYSHTTVTPVFEGKPIQRAVRRLDLGGKHLTNLLKEIISVRHFDLHQDTKIVNDIKEEVCFVSRDFASDMEKTWKGNKRKPHPVTRVDDEQMDVDSNDADHDIRVDYVLPDGMRLLRGFSRPHDPSVAAARKRKLNASSADTSEVSMTLGNERFSVPEVVFSPMDIGSKQAGLADCVMQSLACLPPLLQATLLANTLVVGGNARIPGFTERLEDDLRSHVLSEWPVRVRTMQDPVTSTWRGGCRLATKYRHVLRDYAVTKAEYDEHGSNWVARKFVHGSSIKPS